MEGTLLWILLGLLLVLSGLFSATETALFSLDTAQLRRVGNRVARMLERPQDLLVSVLFGNLLVNIAFFAFSARLAAETETSRLTAGFVVLLVLLVFGEILPKTLALRAPAPVAQFVALPLEAFVRLTHPIRVVVAAVLSVVFRALGEAARDERDITPEMLEQVLEHSSQHGLLEGTEADFLSEVFELEKIRVREIMTPRVDMLAVDLTAEDPLACRDEAFARRLSWLPVVEGHADQVVGRVRLRDLYLHADRPVRQLLVPVNYVPEVASAMALLGVLRENRTTEAIVVDEWGGTAGIVTIEDVFEEIVGELRVEGEVREQPVVPLGEGRYRVAGNLPVRDWNEQFGLRVVPIEFETVAGMITALLGRIPRVGDTVRLGSLVAEVEEVRGRRVLHVDMWVDPAGELQGAGA